MVVAYIDNMESKIINIYFDQNAYPFKDKERSVIYPITGSAFVGFSATQKIRFFVDRIGGVLDTTWVATTKLPNGQLIYELLQNTNYDSEIGEYYVELTLTQPYSALKGDISIGLSGYQGGVEVQEDEDTGIYTIVGTPTIQTSAVIKFNINYTPSALPKQTLGFTDLQQVLAYMSNFAKQEDSIVVIENTSVDLSGFEDGQVFYCKLGQLFYRLDSGNLVADKDGYVPYTGATKNVDLGNHTITALRFISGDGSETTYRERNLLYITHGAYSNTYIFRVKNANTNDYVATEDYVDNNIYEMASASVVLSDSDYAYLLKNNVRIHYGELYYEKAKETASQVVFYSINDIRNTTGSATNGYTTYTKKKITLTKSSQQLDAADINDVFYNKAQADTELAKKQNNLTFDNTPTADSNNPVKSGGIKTYVDAFGKSIDLSLNTTNYKLTATLKDANGNSLSSKEVDLPLESIVVSANYYDSYTYGGTTYQKVIVITLATTSVPTIVPVGDLVSGLANDDEVVHLTKNETIAGNKTFTGDTTFTYDINFKSPDGTKSGAFRLANNGNFIWRIGNASKLMYDYANGNFSSWVDIVANGDNAQSLGNSSHYWKDLYLKGYLTDGNVSFKLSDLYTKTQIDTLFGNYYNKEETNDLLDQKANVNGNYPTMTVGLSDNLTPYSDDSGTEQTQPFINQGTGTGNGAEIITTGDYALLKEKQGNSVVANQIVPNYNFATNSHWSTSNSTKVISGNKVRIIPTASATLVELYQGSLKYIAGHKYLYSTTFKSDITLNRVRFGQVGNTNRYIENTSGATMSYIDTAISTDQYVDIYFYKDDGYAGTEYIDVFIAYAVDLTQYFGSNDLIPQDLLDHPENWARYYNGSLAYNVGSLENANGRYLVCGGRNVWDEQWEYVESRIYAKNYIQVIPNATYYIKCPTGVDIRFLDKNENAISDWIWKPLSAPTFEVPSNAYYVKFRTTATYGTTYNNDITISLYYTPEQGGEGYNQYYPYKQPVIVDTGTEVLRSAGSVKDSKAPDGTITRRVGVVDLGTLSWNYDNAGYYYTVFADVKSNTDNVMHISYITNSLSVSNPSCPNRTIEVGTQILFIKDTSTPTGILYFELATETTESGTPYTEVLQIDDYGNMLWKNTSNELVAIPQGNKIFYPVNYKGFIDDLYSRSNGDASDFVVQSERSADKTQLQAVDTQLLNAIGGTLRQVLCIRDSILFENTDVFDISKQSITYVSTYSYFQIQISGASSTRNAAINTKYRQVSSYNDMLSNDMCFYKSDSNMFYLKDSGYTSADTFKEANKGVLVAYEKA